MGVLAPLGAGCKPFDEQRAGFVMTEGAAAVCIQRCATGNIGVQIGRYALGGDATHLTSGDPNTRTLRRLLRDVIHDTPVDLIHAHGTGTVVNDPSEIEAIESALWSTHLRDQNDDRSGCDQVKTLFPILYSHKAALGHSLGVAGLIGVVLNVESHRHHVVPPNIRTTTPIASRMNLSTRPIHQPIRRSIVTAAGFGGAIGVVALETTELARIRANVI